MNIALSTDHAGFEQLKELQIHLEALGYMCKNFGPTQFNPEDDYPDFIIPAAQAVSKGEYQFGIVLGRSGQGEAMAANRIKGVRCAVFYGPALAKRAVDADGATSHDHYEIIRRSRQHNDSNMLSLAASYVDLEEMKTVIGLWLETSFSKENRHIRRHEKLDQMD